MTVDMGQLLTDQLGATTNVHQANTVTIAKAQDYQYLNSLNTAAHSLAWREVQTDPNSSGLAAQLAMLQAFGKST